ncbi:MAG TPA: response regulator transcription factor [Bryobacteraceae bacterium]|jgi:DNA-binding NarL/FixJ family response regulator|nr:response regulator transcription factor [Bryobacteraceae bacterium]
MRQAATDVINILVLDDHSLFRRGLVRLLEAEPDIRVVADCATSAEALACMSATPADIVLLDYDLGPERGTEFLSALKNKGIRARVLAVTAGVSPLHAMAMMQYGVAGIFLKADPPELLVLAIRKIMAGEVWFSQDDFRALVERTWERSRESKNFSPKERAVLRGVVEGLANKEIAAELQASESSVKAVIQQLFAKTGVRTRSQLVRIALERHRDIVT